MGQTKRVIVASLALAGFIACQEDSGNEDTGSGGGTPLLPNVTSAGPGAGPGPGAGGSGAATSGPGSGGNTGSGASGSGGNGTGAGGNGTGAGGAGGSCGGVAPGLSDLVINELHTSPSSSVDDVNCDSTPSTDDEFIEILNVSANVLDLSGVELKENGTTRHTFTGCLAAERAIVVYNKGLTSMCGAGDWGDTTGVAPDTNFTLTNSGGEEISLTSTAGTHDTVTTVNLSSNPRTSMTRSPDGTGSFVEHDTVGGAFSVGTCIDGGFFPCD